ncbi:MAG: acyl-CoA dehydrogenase family protein [Proteobacteria bacterium]|nr:acyl-CoA dehydrogenase family protein [Pseudomonadota bacterium]
MDLTLPPEIEQVRDTVRRLLVDEIIPATPAFEASGEFPRPLVEKLGEAGLFGAAFGEDVGGTAMGFQAVAAIAEEISRLAPEYGYCMNMQAMTCPFTIYNWGTEDQVRRFVPDLVAGKRIGMFALSEPGGGSDAAGAMKTTARRDGDVYRLNGSKQWITFANACDTGLLFAKTDPAAGVRGISAFIVEPKSVPGFTADPIAMTGLSNSLRSCAVFLDDFAVPVENRLGAEGEGFKIAMNGLDYGRLTVTARLIGLARACLDLARDYAKERVVFGHPIATYQMVQHLIADMTVNIEASRLMLHRMAWTMDRGDPATREASQAKYFASTTAKHAAQSAAEVFGGYALADEYPIKKIAAYVNMLNMGEGSPNTQRILIAEDSLGFKDANRHAVRRRLKPAAS